MGFFLCLSLVMAIIAIVRISKIRDIRGEDVVWSGFWLTIEGCVAVLMTSITSFRTAFTGRGTRDSGEKRWAPSHSWVQRARLRNRSEGDDVLERGQLPSIPSALLTGVRSYIQEYHQTAESNTWTGSDTRSLNEVDSTQWSVEDVPRNQYAHVQRESRVGSLVRLDSRPLVGACHE